jgi:hypothetical protein
MSEIPARSVANRDREALDVRDPRLLGHWSEQQGLTGTSPRPSPLLICGRVSIGHVDDGPVVVLCIGGGAIDRRLGLELRADLEPFVPGPGVVSERPGLDRPVDVPARGAPRRSCSDRDRLADGALPANRITRDPEAAARKHARRIRTEIASTLGVRARSVRIPDRDRLDPRGPRPIGPDSGPRPPRPTKAR